MQFRKNKSYKNALWITENIKLLQKLSSKALKKYKHTKLPANYEYYKQLRNYTAAAIQSEKKVYLRLKFQNCSAREKWGELRNFDIIKNKTNKLPDNLCNANDLNNFLRTLQTIIYFQINTF